MTAFPSTYVLARVGIRDRSAIEKDPQPAWLAGRAEHEEHPPGAEVEPQRGVRHGGGAVDAEPRQLLA